MMTLDDQKELDVIILMSNTQDERMVRILEVFMETERPVPDTEGKETDLMGRAAEIFQEFGGPRWSEIAKELEGEGYLEDGKPVSSNALRKRFQKDPVLRRLLEDSRQGKLQPKDISVLAVPKEVLENQSAQPLGRVKRGMTDEHTGDTTITAKEMLALLRDSMERRDGMFLEQIRKSNTTDESIVILQVEGRMMEKLKMMEERLQAAEERLAILVEDKVDEGLRSMVTPGSAFARDLESLFTDIIVKPESPVAKDLESLVTRVIDERLSGEVGTLLSALPVAPGHPGGPGKAEGEGKMARFSATMPQHLFEALKSMKGEASFSARIAAAVDFYLRAMAAQKSNTE